jgi:tRNA A-37 threonylcarbamoyl transferase component Bud32
VRSRLKSKKNVVLHLRTKPGGRSGTTNFVAKLFVADTFQTEVDVLHLCERGAVPVPKVIVAREGVILMEYITGENLISHLNRTFSDSAVRGMANWYLTFHSATNLVKGDSVLRNFIIHRGSLTGVDFEESHRGHWIEDIAGSAASLLDTDPVFDARKRVLAWVLLEEYLRLSGEERTSDIERQFTTAIADSLCCTARWRGSSEILMLSEFIRNNGIPID